MKNLGIPGPSEGFSAGQDDRVGEDMLSDEQLRQGKEKLARIKGKLSLVVHVEHHRSRLSDELWRFADCLSKNMDKIEARRVFEKSEKAFLGLEIDRHERIRYSVLPIKDQWVPFLNTLCIFGGLLNDVFSEQEISTMGLVKRSRLIEVFVQNRCPHCSYAVTMANAMAIRDPQITAWILDAQAFQERVRELNIMATPTILIDGDVRWAGAVKTGDFVDFFRLDEQDWLKTLISLLNSDALDSAVSAVLGNDLAALAAPNLLTEPEMSFHMAMLRIVEECVARDGEAAKRLRKPLEALADHKDANVRGDAVYGLGLLGDPQAIETLERASMDADEDVREAALDALAELDAV